MLGNVDGLSNDYVAGWCQDPDAPGRRVPVDLIYNGRRLGPFQAAFSRGDLHSAGVGDGHHAFSIPLPVLTTRETAEISIVVSATDEQIGEPQQLDRLPLCSAAGVLAADVQRLLRLPLHFAQNISFDGQDLVVRGVHLAAAGDPFNVKLRGPAATSYQFRYPLDTPDVRDWYWFWPHSGTAGYELTVDLLASSDPEPRLEFEFFVDGLDSEETTAYAALGRNLLTIPKDLRRFQNFPTDADRLTRVQSFDAPKSVALQSYLQYSALRRIAVSNGVDLRRANVLDWGCGHGRLIRHFVDEDGVANASAVDVDSDNVEWVRRNLPNVRAATVPLMPPTELPAAYFDLVFGVSVMTHLREAVQRAWLEELRRIVRPGGLVILTFHGAPAVAFNSRYMTPDVFESWSTHGYDDSVRDSALDEWIPDHEYYRNVFQRLDLTIEWCSKYFEVVATAEAALGYQDVAVLRAT